MYYRFSAKRISGNGNTVFPDELIIDDESITFQKKKVIGYSRTKITFESISSVSIDKNLLFADITIETNGGMKISAYGFSKRDASMIVGLLENRY
ncbi:MAG: PH domain-containing protein [Paramuribaculum sp.]|nr:PH domain-containing protein [Paramuribaculum sp.]